MNGNNRQKQKADIKPQTAITKLLQTTAARVNYTFAPKLIQLLISNYMPI